MSSQVFQGVLVIPVGRAPGTPRQLGDFLPGQLPPHAQHDELALQRGQLLQQVRDRERIHTIGLATPGDLPPASPFLVGRPAAFRAGGVQ
jgi:hypothetical protein